MSGKGKMSGKKTESSNAPMMSQCWTCKSDLGHDPDFQKLNAHYAICNQNTRIASIMKESAAEKAAAKAAAEISPPPPALPNRGEARQALKRSLERGRKALKETLAAQEKEREEKLRKSLNNE